MDIVQWETAYIVPGMLGWANERIGGGRVVMVHRVFSQQEGKAKSKKLAFFYNVETEDGGRTDLRRENVKPLFRQKERLSAKTEQFSFYMAGLGYILGQKVMIARLPFYRLTGHRESLTIGYVAGIDPDPEAKTLLIKTSAVLHSESGTRTPELFIRVKPEEIRAMTDEEIVARADEREFYFEEELLLEDLRADLDNYPGLKPLE